MKKSSQPSKTGKFFMKKWIKDMKKNPFRGLRIKATTAEKFRRYARKISKSQSMTLLLMIDFFEGNNISPSENMGPKMQTLEAAMKKRNDALISIIRDIEQNQTLPTKGMLQAIFEGLPAQSKKKANHSLEEAFKNLTRNQPSLPKTKPETDHKDIRKVLGRLEEVIPRFGKPYWKLALTSSEINHIKSKYHVYED